MATRRTRTSSTVPDRLWSVPAYMPYVQPALTARAIARVEAQLGVRLPRAYLSALRIQNDGYLRLRAHPSGHPDVSDLAGIGPRYPSLLGRDWSEVKAYMAEEGITTPKRIDDLVPFSGDGHYYYCFDYRARGRKREPRVSYVDVETFDVDEVVAPDVGAFLAQLRAPQQRMYGLATHRRPADVATAVSKATGASFRDDGDQLYGYRVFRAKLRGDEFAWLSANRTRRGFVRKSDVDYRKLRARMPEIVDRYPQHADCGYLLTCTSFDSNAGKTLVRNLAKLPFASRALPADAP